MALVPRAFSLCPRDEVMHNGHLERKVAIVFIGEGCAKFLHFAFAVMAVADVEM